MLVKADGLVKSIRDYDSSGGMLSRTPRDDRDPFGFTGGIDAGNGLWKLGARFYDSGKGSFVQQDRYMGDPSDPLSLNRYVYCQLDPVNFVDPTGFMGEYVADWGRQVMNSAPHPYLKAVGVAILVVGTAIILVETIPDIIMEAKNNKNGEYKTPKSGVSGKEGAKDVPSWAKGNKPYKGESGKDFAKRLLDEKYGEGNYSNEPGSEYSKLKKWGDRSFE